MSEERFVERRDPDGKLRRIYVTEMKLPRAPQKAQKREKEIFVQLSPIWQKRLHGLSGKTQSVGRVILELHFKNYGRPVKLTNGPLLTIGIGRRAKKQALDELETCGLIEVERRRRKTPIVRPLHTMMKE
jgi:hypothetical protein